MGQQAPWERHEADVQELLGLDSTTSGARKQAWSSPPSRLTQVKRSTLRRSTSSWLEAATGKKSSMGEPKKCAPGCTCGKHRKAPLSEDTKRRISASLVGHPVSSGTRIKMAERATARYQEPGSKDFLRYERTSETRALLSEAQLSNWREDDYRASQSKALRGRDMRGVPSGRWVNDDGYVLLANQHDHPLASRGVVAEHRLVLFDRLGAGVHLCHWCGRELEWGATEERRVLCVDHLDWNKSNNLSENLVPSCRVCNAQRRGNVQA